MRRLVDGVPGGYAAGRSDGRFRITAHADPGSGNWPAESTSGSLLADDRTGWTGPIDGVDPDTYSRRQTDSAVFRLVSRRSDFRNVRVEFAPDVARLSSTTRTPPQAYDGVHVFLRYKSAQLLDAISVFRRTARSRSRRRCPAVR